MIRKKSHLRGISHHMPSIPNSPLALATALTGLCFLSPILVVGQFNTWTLPAPENTGDLFSTDLEVISPARSLIGAYALDWAPGGTAHGLVASIVDGELDWAKAIVGDSSYQMLWGGDSLIFGGLRGTVHAITPATQDRILITGSVYTDSSFKAMVALLTSAGDTLWTTWVGEGDTLAPIFLDAAQAADGSFYCAGTDKVHTWDGNARAICARFTEQGDLIWYRKLELPDTGATVAGCFTQGDTLLLFTAMEPDSTTSGVAITRISSGGELLSHQRLLAPPGFRLRSAAEDGSGGYVLFCDSTFSMSDDSLSFLLALRLTGQLEQVGPQVKVSYAHGISTTAGRIVYDPATARAYIAHIAHDALETNRSFIFCLDLSEQVIEWARMTGYWSVSGLQCALVQAGNQTALRLLFARWNEWFHTMELEATTGEDRLDSLCAPGPGDWHFTLGATEASVSWAEEAITLSTPLTEVGHGLTIWDLALTQETCPVVCPDSSALGPIQVDPLVLVDGTVMFTVEASEPITWSFPVDWSAIGATDNDTLTVLIGGEDHISVQVCAEVTSALCPDSVCVTVYVDGTVGLAAEAVVPTTVVWPNPVAPGELVRFANHAQVYDTLGRTIRTNVTQMAAPEQPGCYLVVTGERRSVLVVQ